MTHQHPEIIQGGMGVGVSGWRLARAVAQAGQLGVVSGTAAAVMLARHLQLGDPGGHARRALAHLPIAGLAQRVLDRHFIEGGKPADKPFKALTMPTVPLCAEHVDLLVAGNFVDIYLAKEGHAGVVGVNYLEKVQIPTLPSLFGAMLAGVDYVLMGAGVPRAIPGVLDRLARGERVSLKIDVPDLRPGEEVVSTFDPADYCGGAAPVALRRPFFLAIVSSATLATALARKSSGRVDGFVVEAPSAGGHNAPPRGPLRLNERGEPLYGEADVPDLARIGALGLPFWLAGARARPAALVEARRLGAAGIQVGTAFAFCEESGIGEDLKRRVIEQVRSGVGVEVRTEATASPTGFPFKVVQMAGTLSDAGVYAARPRRCDVGYLRSNYRRPDGSLGHRCPAEPVDAYVRKGGAAADTVGRVCLCNGLLATAGFAQAHPTDGPEPSILTAGDDVDCVARVIPPGQTSYAAADVVRYLLGEKAMT